MRQVNKFYKSLLFVCLLQIFSSIDLFAQGRFELSGTIDKKYEGGYIKLMGKYSSYSGFTSIRSEIENGKFYFTEEISKEYEPVFLEVWKDGKTAGASFFINPGKSHIDIKNIDKDPNKNEIEYIGIPFLAIQKEYNEFIKNASDKVLDYGNFIASVKKETNGNVPDSLMARYSAYKKIFTSKKIEFIRNHPDSYFSLYTFVHSVLNVRLLDSDSLQIMFEIFNSELKNTAEGRLAQTLINKKSTIHVNNLLPDFSFKTIAGQQYSLSDFRDKKYVLICFWASWCKGCIENIPLLTSINLKFQEKGLQVISISLDDGNEKWMKALAKHPMPWLQTCDIPSYMLNQKLRENFTVDLVPQYFLVDKKGKLIYHSIKSTDINSDQYNELQSILQKQLN